MTIQEEVLAVVRKRCAAMRFAYAPEMLINGPDGFYGEEAEDLIYRAADKIDLPRDEVVCSFPYATYFEPEANLSLWPFLLVKHLFERPSGRPACSPLTATEFADLLASLKQNARTPYRVPPIA